MVSATLAEVGSKQLKSARARRGALVLLLCAGMAGFGAILGIVLGPFGISIGDFFTILISQFTGQELDQGMALKESVILNIRMPRVILAIFAGATLGIAGAAMQGFFRNPLADPGLIGVSTGAAFAAVAVIVLGGGILAPLMAALGTFALPMTAFIGALGAVALIYQVSLVNGRVVVATMLLCGVAMNSLAASGIGYMTFLADDNQLRDLTFWTLGSLGGAIWNRVLPAVFLMTIAIAGLLTLARPMNSLLLGENDAANLGVNVEAVKLSAAVFTALGVGAATAVCGVIGFIGLVVPHLVRLMTGPDHRYVLPGSALLGAALILGADLIARIAEAPAELPLGVVTAAIGAPFFFWLLMKDKRKGMFG